MSKNRKIGILQSWGAIKDLKGLNSPQGFEESNLFSKVMLQGFISRLEAELATKIDGQLVSGKRSVIVCHTSSELLSESRDLFEQNRNLLLKSEFGASGRGQLKINIGDLKRDNVVGFINQTFAAG